MRAKANEADMQALIAKFEAQNNEVKPFNPGAVELTDEMVKKWDAYEDEIIDLKTQVDGLQEKLEAANNQNLFALKLEQIHTYTEKVEK